MQTAYVYETRQFCVDCHAPLPEQAVEIAANAGWYASQDPRAPVAVTPPRSPEPWAREGITCVACHPGSASHELRPTVSCESCHDFLVPGTDVPMQSTTAEWRAWGGSSTCQDCHMPYGDHRFRGASDPDLLRQAIRVTPLRDAEGLVLTLEARGVGHQVPTGDIFRQIRVEVLGTHGWAEVARFGRELDHGFDEWTGDSQTTLARDVRLTPGVPVPVRIAGVELQQWRVRYLYTSEPELWAVLPPSEREVILIEGQD